MAVQPVDGPVGTVVVNTRPRLSTVAQKETVGQDTASMPFPGSKGTKPQAVSPPAGSVEKTMSGPETPTHRWTVGEEVVGGSSSGVSVQAPATAGLRVISTPEPELATQKSLAGQDGR